MRRKRGAHNRLPISEFSLRLALKDPERLGAVMTPISRNADRAAQGRGRGRLPPGDRDASRAALLIQQTVMYGWLMNRFVQNPKARVDLAKDAWEFCLPRPRRLTPKQNPTARAGGVSTRASRTADGRGRGAPSMKNAVIVQALRTPIGRARKGSLVTKDAFELAQVVVRAMLERTKIEPSEITTSSSPRACTGAGSLHATRRSCWASIAFQGWRRIGTAQPASEPSRPQPDRSRPAWIASSSPEGPRA